MTKRMQSPMRLVTWAFVGSLLIASIFFLTFLPIPRLPTDGPGFWSAFWAVRLRLAVVGLPFIAGVAIWRRAQSLFRRGFIGGVWSDEELASARALVERPLWRWICACLLLIAFAYMALAPRGLSHVSFIYGLFLPLQAISEIRQLLTPRRVEHGGLRDWRSFKPLHSEHWGQAGREDSLSS